MEASNLRAEVEARNAVVCAGLALAEVNLLKYPFALLLNNRLDEFLEEAAKRRKTHILCEVELPDGSKRIWQVNPSIQFGYPRPFDKKVLFTVFKLVTDEGFPPPPIWKLGSLRRICQTMGIQDAGENKRLVKESLLRISQTSIYTEVFYLRDRDGFWQERPNSVGGSFTLWNVVWRGEKLPDGKVAEAIYLIFNIPFIWSLQAFYVCPIDYYYWLNLPPLAQRLYEITGRKFYGLEKSEYIRYSYLELCRLLPIKPQEHLSDAKRVLNRAHKVLKDTGWLAKVQWTGTKTRKFSAAEPWEILYYPGPRAKEEVAQAKNRLARVLPYYELNLEEEIERQARIENIVSEIEHVTGDRHSRPTYYRIARNLPEDVIWRFLSELKADYLYGPLKVKTSLAAIFMDKIKRYCQERGIDIGIKFET